MLHGLRLVGRLASSAAVWESRSLPAFSLGVRRQLDRQHTVSHAAWAPFGGPPRKLGGGVGEEGAGGIFFTCTPAVRSPAHSFPCCMGSVFRAASQSSAAVWESRSLPAFFLDPAS